MGSPLFKHTSWAQRDHLVSWRFGMRGDEDQTGCADSGLDLFLRNSKQSATRLRPKQAALCARLDKWMSLSLKYDLGWHSYVSNKMSFAQFGLSRMSSPEEPAGKMLPFSQRTGSHLFCAIHLPSILRSAPRFVVPLIVPKIDDITTSPQPRFRTSEEYKCEACKHWLLRNFPLPPQCLCVWCCDLETLQEFTEKVSEREKKKCFVRQGELNSESQRNVL